MAQARSQACAVLLGPGKRDRRRSSSHRQPWPSLDGLRRNGNVLRYPIIHRWRLFRIKQRLVPCKGDAL
jgi:hypothetical protein